MNEAVTTVMDAIAMLALAAALAVWAGQAAGSAALGLAVFGAAVIAVSALISALARREAPA